MLILFKFTTKIVDIFQKKVILEFMDRFDSQITLFLCKDHASRWTTFMLNRMSQIQELTSDFKWTNVRSNINPADVLCPGKVSKEIINFGFWFHGPGFLNISSTNLDNYNLALTIKISPVPEEKKITFLTTYLPQEFTFW